MGGRYDWMTFFDLVFSSEFKWIHNWSKSGLIRKLFWEEVLKVRFGWTLLQILWVTIRFRQKSLSSQSYDDRKYLTHYLGSKAEFRWDPIVSSLFKSSSKAQIRRNVPRWRKNVWNPMGTPWTGWYLRIYQISVRSRRSRRFSNIIPRREGSR